MAFQLLDIFPYSVSLSQLSPKVNLRLRQGHMALCSDEMLIEDV